MAVMDSDGVMDSARPVFVVGCPRSGTTLLSAMLHAHPNIAMPPETRFLLPIYEHRERYGDLRVRANRRRLAKRITAPKTLFDDLHLDRARVIEAIVAAPPTLGSALARVWQEFARDRGKARWGEKRPAYWREMDVILRLFPTAQVVHLVRDPRACVASLEQVDWWHRSPASSAALWVSAERELSRLGRRLPADSYHRLRYEDLTADPRPVLQQLCAFLGEPFDEAMLEHASASADIVPQRKAWHARVHGKVDAARSEAWRGVLTPAQIGLVESVARLPMRRRGYDRSGLGERPAPRELADFAATMLRMRLWLARRRAADARLRRRVPMPLAAEL
jgi:hypothetical protein